MLGIVAFIGIFIATYYAYKTANDYDRNPFLWAGLVFAVGFGLQVVIPILLVLSIGIYQVASGADPESIEQSLDGIATIITIVSVVLSVVGMVLILKHLGTIPDDYLENDNTPPPPPTNFNQ